MPIFYVYSKIARCFLVNAFSFSVLLSTSYDDNFEYQYTDIKVNIIKKYIYLPAKHIIKYYL